MNGVLLLMWLTVLRRIDGYRNKFARNVYTPTTDNAAFFSGSEIVQFKKTKILNTKFTIELWMQPEGGQETEVPVVNYYNQCVDESEASIWQLGLKEVSEGRDQRIFFSLKTRRNKEEHRVFAHVGYKAGVWVHVAAVYNGTTLVLFVNQAQVSVSHKKLSPVSANVFSKCETLELGGDSRRSRYFRGTVDDLKVWNIAKSHRRIVRDMDTNVFNPKFNDLALKEDFEAVYNNGNGPSYFSVAQKSPKLVDSSRPQELHDIQLRVPLCGKTVCDNPEVVRGYKDNSYLKGRKIIRYRLINIADDNGENPLVESAQIKIQHKGLNEAFSRYNITWKRTDFMIKNTSIRNKIIIFDCHRDGVKCYNVLTGANPGKNYLRVPEFKKLINLDSKRYLNVFVANFNNIIHGRSSFPWDKHALGVQGGTIINSKRFGKIAGVNDMIHELGHNLGLWHVHRGVTELKCDDKCFETHASMELGDLCADTNPTPINNKCSDPKIGVCSTKRFKNTPFRNYMSYGTGSCPNQFSKDQVARMHCYIDMRYHSWRSIKTGPSAIAVPPKIVSYRKGLLQIEWLPPIGIKAEFEENICKFCSSRGKLQQYGFTAVSPTRGGHNNWAPDKVTGPPDADKCIYAENIWVPDPPNNSKGTSSFIEVGFKYAVIPSRIKVWVTYNLVNGLDEIELLHTDGSVKSLGRARVQCDTPFTRRIFTKKPVNKVRLRVSDHSHNIGIDAVQLISEKNYKYCINCPRVEYIVQRKPPFHSAASKIATDTRFVDREISGNVAYEYRIQTLVGGALSPPSLPLKFSAKIGFCGDGVIQKQNNEDCDDGNSRDGDGCNILCRREDVFRCKGQPSICYKYEGDGVCEEFEKQISMVDCGFYVPDGFQDQWAVAAEASSEGSNPISVITGPPPLDLKCIHSTATEKKSWSFCKNSYDCYDKSDNWIEASFKNPVVASAVILYIASDGAQDSKKKRDTNIVLIDSKGVKHRIGNNPIHLNCKRHPVTIPVFEKTKAYFKTKKVKIIFSSHQVAVSAVALRSSTKMSPPVESGCGMNELDSLKSQSCFSYRCSRPFCKPLAIKNARITCKGTSLGDVCHVCCREGYLPSKQRSFKCTLGKWKGPIKSCVPVDCGKAEIKRAKVDCKEGTTFQKVCSFHCISPAKLIGKDNRVVCQKDGLWSERTASCQMLCPAPRQIENGTPLKESCDVNHMKARRRNDMGSVCRFECLPGFEVTGTSSAAIGKHIKVTCMEDGKWLQDASCQRVRCPQLSLFENLVYNCTNENAYESVCVTVCPHDKVVHKVRCQQDGRWSSSLSYCQYHGECSVADTSMISFSSCENGVKSICEPKCKRKGHDLVIRGKEEKHNVHIICLPENTWYPDPNSLYCMPSCVKETKGDGYCNCENNNNHCNYDDGDCCAATVKDGKLSEESCRNSDPCCRCKDPRVKGVDEGGYQAIGSGYEAAFQMNGDDEGGDDEIGVFDSSY